MEQFEFFDIPSPCIGVCQTDARGYCKGCLRSREERFNWINYSYAVKQEIITTLIHRKKRRILALIKAKNNHNFEADAANDLFSESTKELVQSVLDKPELVENLDEERLNILWEFLKYFFMPLLVGTILIIFQQNYDHILSYIKGVNDIETLRSLAMNGRIVTTSGEWAIVTATNLNFRSGPTLSATILAKLKRGEPIEIIDNMDATWLYVRAMIDDELRSGWVCRKYIVIVKK